jgi:hypothetical protein
MQEGWTVRGAGLVLHAPDGCWGQIVFSGASREHTVGRPWNVPDYRNLVAEWPILEMSLTAGTCAPYLMQFVNKLDPSKPPSRNFVAAHTQVCWYAPVWFARAARVISPPFEIPEDAMMANRYCIDVDTAAPWLAAALDTLAPATQALSSNRAIYDRLSAQKGCFSLRSAYLLARHLRLDSDLAPLEERARTAAGSQGMSADRQTTYPQDWSHERFMRFVDNTPR